jgi:nucleotide-binding universal stress UspA family protein
VFLNVLVAFDGSPSARAALREAVDLSRAENAKLTILGVVPPLPAFAYRAGVSIDRLREEAAGEVAEWLRAARAELPDDMPATTIQREGHAGEEIVKQVEGGGHDLVVLGTRRWGRLRANVFGSVNAYVHFHSTVPMLIVSATDAPDEVEESTAS